MTWEIPKYGDPLDSSSSKNLPSSKPVKEVKHNGRSIKHLDEGRLLGFMFAVNVVVVCAAIACCFFQDSMVQK